MDKKPAFRYSGCHAYEVSALNVVLGKVFDFDESKYIIDDKYKLFVKNSDIEVRKNEEEDNDVKDEDIEMTWKLRDMSFIFKKNIESCVAFIRLLLKLCIMS